MPDLSATSTLSLCTCRLRASDDSSSARRGGWSVSGAISVYAFLLVASDAPFFVALQTGKLLLDPASD